MSKKTSTCPSHVDPRVMTIICGIVHAVHSLTQHLNDNGTKIIKMNGLFYYITKDCLFRIRGIASSITFSQGFIHKNKD